MSNKRRVYEVARDLDVDNKVLLSALENLGVKDVKNHMSVLSTDDEDRVKKHLGKGAAPAPAADDAADPSRPRVVKRRSAVVVRRRREDGSVEESAADSVAEDSSPRTAAEERSAPAHPTPTADEAPAASARAPEPPPAPKPASPAAAAPPGAAPGAAPAPGASDIERTSQDKASQERSPQDKLESSDGEVRSAHHDPSHRMTVVRRPAHERPHAHADAPEAEVGAPEPSTPPVGDASVAQAGQSVPPASAAPPSGLARPSQAPKRGVEVWEGRPGVPMHQHKPGTPRRSVYDAKAPMGGARRPGGPGGPGGRMMHGGRPGGPGGKGRPGTFTRSRGIGPPVTKERGAHKKVVRIEETVNLQTLAANMGVKATDLLRKLLQLGMTGININSTLDADTAKIVATEFGWEVEDVAVSEEEQLQKAQGVVTADEADENALPRPPVVTVMGHVDHGKTSLLDALRATNVVSGEAGGITQHIGAYSVSTDHGKITFLDTPGHAAFTQMRARGAQATDLVVLVVAADDGVMPQTREALSHAKAAGVPVVVAINKCDKPDAQPDRVRRELADMGLIPEEWGGEVMFTEVSAHTRQGLPELLERIILQAEVLELRANPNKPGSGIVIEAQLDRGRGPVATVLVTEGTLRQGDVILAGAGFGKVRAMHDFAGREHKDAGPSEPVSIIGLSDVPRAGDQVYVVKDLKTAQAIAETRKVKERRSLAPSAGNKPRTLEEIARMMAESDQLELKVIIKADVAGSAEAVAESLVGLSTEKVKVSVVLQAAGAINENDVNLAVAAGAIIVGFNAKPAGKAAQVAQREGIEIRQYSIIYNVLDDVKLAMEGLLAPTLVEKALGKAEVRQTFRISKAGTVAGSMIIDGVVRRNAGARLLRAGAMVYEGKVSGLKRFKEDVREVKEGFECGISLDGWDEIHVGDIVEVFEMQEVKQSL